MSDTSAHFCTACEIACCHGCSACVYTCALLHLANFASSSLRCLCMGICRMGQRTPVHHPPLQWTMPPMLPQHQLCLPAAQQKMKKTALLPMASTCQMAQLSSTATASDASMSAVQSRMPMPVLVQDVRSINSQMTASGASCLPPFLLSIVCGGSVEEDLPNHQVTNQ